MLQEDGFWVAVVMDVNGPDTQEKLLRLSHENLAVFAEQPGFRSGRILQSHDGRKVVSLIQWANEEDHQACLDNQLWQNRSEEWLDLIHQGKARMEVITMAVAASSSR